MQASESDNWMPLESNPEVMNPFAAGIGANIWRLILSLGINIEQFCFHDLLGFEEWAFEMIPKPVLGVVFNLPFKPEYDKFN